MKQELKPELIYLGLGNHSAPTTRYRFLQFLPFLEAAGFRCTLLPLMGDRYLHAERYQGFRRQAHRGIAFVEGALRRLVQLTTLPDDALLIIERELLPYLPPVIERVLASRRRGYILEFDDAQYLLPGRRQKFQRLISNARAVLVGNENLAEFARGYQKNVHVVPTVVDLDDYPASIESDQRFRIGWIGLPQNFQHLKSIEYALSDVCLRYAADFVVCSSRPPKLCFPFIFEPWGERREKELAASFDLGIMPLEDSPYSAGKCGLKLLQYMAGRAAVVASPVGVNTNMVQSGKNGFLAESPAEWGTFLGQLATERQRCLEMGENGHAFAAKHYSLQVWAPKLVDLYLSFL